MTRTQPRFVAVLIYGLALTLFALRALEREGGSARAGRPDPEANAAVSRADRRANRRGERVRPFQGQGPMRQRTPEVAAPSQQAP